MIRVLAEVIVFLNKLDDDVEFPLVSGVLATSRRERKRIVDNRYLNKDLITKGFYRLYLLELSNNKAICEA